VCGPVAVLVELLRKLAPLFTKRPENVFFFIRLEGIYKLGLVADRMFITRILSLTSGSIPAFLGNCLA
jgi:hypothetical protein